MAIMTQNLALIKSADKDLAVKVLEHAFNLCVKFCPEKNVLIKFGRGINQAGSARHFRQKDNWELTLSINFVEQVGFDFMDNTIRHEIAHIIAGIEAGHGLEWKKTAIMVGAKPETYHSENLVQLKKWALQCKCCGRIGSTFARKPRNTRLCGLCSFQGIRDNDCIMLLITNPEYVKAKM